MGRRRDRARDLRRRAAPDPFGIIAAVEDHLTRLDAPRLARDILNILHGLVGRFAEVTGSTSYLLSRAPDVIQPVIGAEVRRQGVRHSVVAMSSRPADGLFVEIGTSFFVCAPAKAEF